ncbi:MAG: rhodanese-like domain-containing protein [Acidimicrobiia bacterium]
MTDATVPETDVDGLVAARALGAVVLDVRQPDEYELAHVPGAVLVPLDQLGAGLDRVPPGELYVICRSGARSARAVQLLAQAGREATNVAGGTQAWIDAGQPVVTGSSPA